MKDHALYYPHIGMNDAALVKGMALYYDSIYRIVPDGEIPDDHPDLQPLIEQGEIGRMIGPAPYASSAASEFLKRSKRWNAAALMFDDEDGSGVTAIHHDKTDKRVRALFKKAGFKHQGVWTHVPIDVASNYMLYLAGDIARQNQLALMTSDWGAWTGTSYFQVDGMVNDWVPPIGSDTEIPEDVSFGVFGLVLSELVPMNIQDISSEDILEFRDRRRDEIRAFRACMQDFSLELSQISDADMRIDAIRDKAACLDRAQKDFRRSADIIGAKKWFGVSMMGFPAPILFSKLLHLPSTSLAVLAGTGIALGGLYGLAAARDEVRRMAATRPESYVLQLKRDFSYATARGLGDMNYQAWNCMEEYVAD